MSAPSAYDIEIDAANIAAAVILESRLSRLAPTTSELRNDWIVEIPGPVNLDHAEAVVRGWLDDLGQRSTTMRFDKLPARIHGRPHTAPTHRASNRNFIG